MIINSTSSSIENNFLVGNTTKKSDDKNTITEYTKDEPKKISGNNTEVLNEETMPYIQELQSQTQLLTPTRYDRIITAKTYSETQKITPVSKTLDKKA